MSSPKLTESPGLNEIQQHFQGDTFIVSDQQIRSKENLDEYQQSGYESSEQKRSDESMSYQQEEEFLCDDLDDFEVDMQNIDEDQYLEDQALESYFYSLKKKVLTTLYKNYQIKQQQKQSLHQVLLRFETKNYFLSWLQLSHQKLSQEIQQHDNSINNGQEIELSKNYFEQQKADISNKIDEFQAQICYDSIVIHQEKQFDTLNNNQKNKQEVENTQKLKENISPFQIQIQNESQTQSKIDKTAYNQEEFQNSNMKSFDYVKEKTLCGNQSEDSNVLKEETQVYEQNEFEINAKNMSQIFQFQINEDQFIDQEQFDGRLDGFSNYSSINCGVQQIFQNNENGQHEAQTYQNPNVYQQKSENQKNKNTGNSSTDRSERNLDLKLQMENAASDSFFLRKDDQKSKGLNSDNQSQLTKQDQAQERVILEQTGPNSITYQPEQKNQKFSTEKVMLEQTQSNSKSFQLQQNKQNALQVEQSIYDERSFDTLCTQKQSQLSMQNKFSNNHQESERNIVLLPQQQQDALDSYRKESSVKLYNLTINNNFAALTNIQSQKHNKIQESTKDKQIDLNDSQKTQPNYQNFISQNEEIKKQFSKNQSVHLAQQYKTSTNQVEASIPTFDKARLQNLQILKNENQSKTQTDQESSLNQQQDSQVSGRSQQTHLDLRQLKSLEDEDQLTLGKENYFTQRNNDNDLDKRLSQIEAFSVSKNIELTPVQQQMILSSHRNNNKNNHTSSISQELEEEQEQAVDDLAHEVAFYIFGKKLFKKLRLAYKTSRTLDRPQSSRSHFTQYSSNEQLRLQQEKIVTMRKCFNMLKKLKKINKKKKEIQQKLFNYYEIRYIRRPLKIWSQNNKVWLAQKVSFTIIVQTMNKLLLIEAFQKIKQHSLSKKRVDTINNLLKYYERTSSPYLTKNTTLEKKINSTISKTTHSKNDKGICKIEQDGSQLHNQKYFQSLEYLDKENNSYLCNVSMIDKQQAADHIAYLRKDSHLQNSSSVISSNKRLKADSKNVEMPKNQFNCNKNSLGTISSTESKAATTPKTYQKKLVEESQHLKQQNLANSIKNKNQQQSKYSSTEGEQNLQICKKAWNLRNYQSIQISEQGNNNSTEISDNNDLNSCNLKASFSELNTKTKNSISYNSDISGIINDKSSMVFNCSRNTLNSERGNNPKQIYQGNCCISNSFKSDNHNFLKTNEEIVSTHHQKNLGNLQCQGEQERVIQKFQRQYEEPFPQNPSLENSFIFESKNNKNCTFSQINQIDLKNEIQTDRQKSQNNLFNQNTNCIIKKPIFTQKGFSKLFENRALPQRNNLNELNFEIETTDFTCNQKTNYQEMLPPPFPHQNLSYQETSLTPKGNQQNQIFSNIQNANNQNQSNSNVIKNQNAFTFTHSQIKNSLSVPTQQNNYNERDHLQVNAKEYQKQLLSYQANNNSYQLKEAGKIKKNSFNKSFIQDQESSDQNDCLETNNKNQNNQKQNQVLVNTFNQNAWSNRCKHSFSFSQNLSTTSKQDICTINNKEINLNSDSNGLISFVNRNRSCSRINQQLELYAEAFNSKKLNSSRNQLNNLNLTQQQNQFCNDQMLRSKIDGQNLVQNFQQVQNNQIEHEMYQDKIQPGRQVNNYSIKPPLKNCQQKTNQSDQDMTASIRTQNQLKQQINIQQQTNKMAKIEQNIEQKSLNFQKDLNGDRNTLNSSIQSNSKTNNNPHFLENHQIVNLKQKLEIVTLRSVLQDEHCSNQHNVSLHMQDESQSFKTTMNYSTYQRQANEQVNQQEFEQQESTICNAPQNYLSHLKNQQFSQRIQETAKQIEKGKLPISQKKQEQINQLLQYQYFKQIQQQRSHQQQHSNKKLSNSSSVNNSFSRNAQKQQNYKNSNNNDSVNVSSERNKKKDLSGVGQSIQNILYFEAKIRSKRLARSQERSKNDSIELCKKLENLEQYIEQINYELKLEKEKKSQLIQENAQLVNYKEYY